MSFVYYNGNVTHFYVFLYVLNNNLTVKNIKKTCTNEIFRNRCLCVCVCASFYMCSPKSQRQLFQFLIWPPGTYKLIEWKPKQIRNLIFCFHFWYLFCNLFLFCWIISHNVNCCRHPITIRNLNTPLNTQRSFMYIVCFLRNYKF